MIRKCSRQNRHHRRALQATTRSSSNRQKQHGVEVRDEANDFFFQWQSKNPLPETLLIDPVLGSAQAAKALNLSTVHLRRLAHAGKIPPPIVIGYRKLGWRLSTIRKVVAECEEAAHLAVAPLKKGGA